MPLATPNLALPTLGGYQLWNDRLVTAGGWRVQRHVVTGHCRTLDPGNVRRAWGDFDACRRAVPDDPPTDRPTVLCLHGLARSRFSMEPMAGHLRDAGFRVLNVGYASTRQDVDAHAETVEAVLRHGPTLDRVHWVGHSLGCLVARRYHARAIGPPLGRVVMLAPPNQGSRLATTLIDNPLFALLNGPSGQLIAEWSTLAATLAVPAEVGVIAGEYAGFTNPLMREAGDLIVGIEETRLPGAETRVLPHSHTLIMNKADTMRLAERFLKTGTFDEGG